jgi:hypothetical protein
MQQFGMPINDFNNPEPLHELLWLDWLQNDLSTIVIPVLADGTLAVGNVVHPSKPVPGHGFGVTKSGAKLKRNNWPITGSDIVTVTVEVSENGAGGPWALLVAFTAGGEDCFDRKGNLLNEIRAEIPVSWAANPNRLTRTTVNNTSIINTKIDMVHK